MIVVCGGLADAVTALLCARLVDMEVAFYFVDLAVYPAGYEVTCDWTTDPPTGRIQDSIGGVELGDVDGVFVRYLQPDLRRGLPSPSDAATPQMCATELDAGLLALIESLPCPVVNRLDGAMTNNSKPLQALAIRDAGFDVPDTLVTTSVTEARAFIDLYDGDVIYKSLSGTRSIVRRVDRTLEERGHLLENGPVQFQEFVDGSNIRVHVVGSTVLAHEIRSSAVDYRYAELESHQVELVPGSVPEEIAERCIRLTRDLDLEMSGIDLKLNSEGNWYCFEVNPAPAFSYYEMHTGQQISRALVHHLAKGGTTIEREHPDEQGDMQ